MDIHERVENWLDVLTDQGSLEVIPCKYCFQTHGCPPGLNHMCYKDYLYEKEMARNEHRIGMLTVEDCLKPPSASPIGTKSSSILKYDLCKICKKKHRMLIDPCDDMEKKCYLDVVRWMEDFVSKLPPSNGNDLNSDSSEEDYRPMPMPGFPEIWGSSRTSNVLSDVPELVMVPPEPANEVKIPIPLKVEVKKPEIINVVSDKHRNQLADSLIKEEEKEIKKKLKKKEKKKRQKAKKKESGQPKTTSEKDNDSSDESDDEDTKDHNPDDLIANSAFANGSKKIGKLTPPLIESKAPLAASIPQPPVKPKETGRHDNFFDLELDGVSSNIYVEHDEVESVRKAKEGANLTKKAAIYEAEGKPVAARSMYTEALMSFNKAIKLWPFDCRYYANRSYVYTQLGEFIPAVRDADKSIELNEDFIKGYFRKGRALLGLKKYDEADASFLKILESDPDCTEAVDEIRGVKLLRLKDMGFADDDVNKALEKHDNIFEDALQYLLNKPQMAPPARVQAPSAAPVPKPVIPAVMKPVFQPVEIIDTSAAKLIVKESTAVDPFEDPRNPAGYKTLWIGNLVEMIDEKKIRTLFSPFGNIDSVFLKPDRKCSFVNYFDPKSAGNAMKQMQGYQLGNTRLKIRYPTNNNTATTQNRPNLVVGKGATTIGTKVAAGKPATVLRPAIENKNPDRVKTVECRHWRSGNCTFGTNCWYIHVPENKGVDKPQA